MARAFKTEDFFAFRTPALPYDFLTEWSSTLRAPQADAEDLPFALEADRDELRSKLREALLRPEIREAIFVASPDMEEMLDPWLQGKLTGEKRDRVERSLVRYLSRMAARSTPFGLFSGCSTGVWGEDSLLKVEGMEAGLRHTRLDMDYLCSLVEALEKDHVVRGTLRYRPNTSLYTAAGRLRYAEVRFNTDKGRDYHLVALEPTPYLEATLERARLGASIEELAHPLVDDEIGLEDANGYIHELIDNQVLVSNLYPAVTGEEPIHGVVARLKSHPDTQDLGAGLGSALARLEALDEGTCERAPETYRQLAKDLEALPAKIKLKHLFQVDLVKPAPEARLSGKVRQDIEEGIELLRCLAPSRNGNSMKRFMDSFRERYESRWVPLLEVLDDESGIGFESGNAPGAEASPLLEGLAFPGREESGGAPFTGRELHLLKHLVANPGEMEWELTSDDLKALKNPDPPMYPDAFAALPVLAAHSHNALDAGEFEMLLEHFSGPSGARLLGRFCHGDSRLEEAVKAHLAAEEALAPDAIFAEIVHLPEGRMGNILCRPLLRGYEIPFLGVSGAEDALQIPLQDLQVSVVGDRVVLRSERLKKEIVPRLSTAHNYSRGLGVYRFLCRMQDQQAINSGWTWGNLDGLPFLPRVRKGRHILSKAKWHVESKELKEIQEADGAKAYTQFRAWREKRKLPRMVLLADGDNTLLVDLENPPWLETLLGLVAKRTGFELQECFPDPHRLLATGPEGRFCHELVVPFLREAPVSPTGVGGEDTGVKHPKNTPMPIAQAPSARTFPPGSEWLYLKVFTGTSTADQILANHIAPLLEETRDLYDRWFFIRYNEGGHHLRLRFHGDPHILTQELQPRIHARLAPLISEGLCWKVQLDTFEREMERYGGPMGIELAEEFFWRDSQAVLDLVQTYPGDGGADLRWRLGLKAVNGLLDGMGFDFETKARIIRRAREGFGREFNSKRGLDVQLGDKFRKLRKELEVLLFEDNAKEALAPGFAILEQRDRDLVACWERLRELESEGQLAGTRAELAPSYTHMHVNRLLRSAQRNQEFAIYDFLDRLYESRLARERKKAKSPAAAGVE